MLTPASPESWAPSHEWDSSCPTCFLIIRLPTPKMNSKEAHIQETARRGSYSPWVSRSQWLPHLGIARTAVGTAAAGSLEPLPAAGAQYSPLLPQPGTGELPAGRLKTPSSLHLEGNPWPPKYLSDSSSSSSSSPLCECPCERRHLESQQP